MGSLRNFRGRRPVIGPNAWVAPNAVLVGDVELGAETSVFYGAVLRGDTCSIRIGARSNVQDLVAVHADPGEPVVVGADVSIGHRAVLHGCTIGDGSLVGMGAVVLNGVVLDEHCMVAAGAVVLEGTTAGPRTLLAGVPARPRRELTDSEVADLAANAADYVTLAAQHAAEVGPEF